MIVLFFPEYIAPQFSPEIKFFWLWIFTPCLPDTVIIVYLPCAFIFRQLHGALKIKPIYLCLVRSGQLILSNHSLKLFNYLFVSFTNPLGAFTANVPKFFGNRRRWLDITMGGQGVKMDITALSGASVIVFLSLMSLHVIILETQFSSVNLIQTNL